MTGPIDGVGISSSQSVYVQGADVKQAQGADRAALPEVLAGARPSRASVVGRVIIGIVTLGFSELVRRCVRLCRQRALREVQAHLPDPRTAEVNRANAPLLAALSGVQDAAMPKNIQNAIEEANESVKRRFGNEADALREGSLMQSKSGLELAKFFQAAIEKGDHVIEPQEVKEQFEMIAARNFLGEELNQYCLDKANDLRTAPEFLGPDLASPVMHGSDVSELLQGVESPDQVEDVKGQIKVKLFEEMKQLNLLSTVYKRYKAEAVAQLKKASGCSEEVVSAQFAKFIGSKCVGLLADAYRNPDTGHVRNQSQFCNHMRFLVDREVKARLDTMKDIGQLFSTDAARRGLLLSALDSRMTPESVKLAKQVADQLDVKVLRFSVTVKGAYATDVSDAIDGVLRQAQKRLTELSGQASLNLDDKEVFAMMGGAVVLALLDKDPELARQLSANKDLLALAGGQLKVDLERPGLTKEAQAENQQISAMLLTLMKHPDINAYDRQIELEGRRKLAAALSDRQPPEDLVTEVKKRADALRVRFGDEIPDDPLQSQAWSVVSSDATMSLWSGKLVEKKDIVQDYEKFAKQNIVLNSIDAYVKESAESLKVASGKFELRGFANSEAVSKRLAEVTSPDQLTNFVTGVQLHVKAEMEIQTGLLAKSEAMAEEAVSVLAKRTSMKKEDVERLCGEEIRNKLSAKLKKLLNSETTPRDLMTGVMTSEGREGIEGELKKVVAELVNARVKVLDAIEKAKVSDHVRNIMVDGMLKGHGFTSPEVVGMVVTTADSMNLETVLENLSRFDKKPQDFLAAVTALMWNGFEILKEKIGTFNNDMEALAQLPLYEAVIALVLERAPQIVEALSKKPAAAAKLFSMAGSASLNAEDGAGQSTAAQMAETFVAMAKDWNRLA